VFFYPSESGGGDRTKEKDGTVVLAEKINRWRTTELPEAANESSCEDIVPPKGEMPSKVEIWEKAKVGFAPMAVSLLSKVGTVT
jgi:hypothetical protein